MNSDPVLCLPSLNDIEVQPNFSYFKYQVFRMYWRDIDLW